MADRVSRLCRLAAPLGVLALFLAGCGLGSYGPPEGGPASGSRAAASTSVAPPVEVRPVTGAPAQWRMNERLARALQAREISASAETAGPASYTLYGRARPGPPDSSEIHFTWQLYDRDGTRVREVTQLATLPQERWEDAKGVTLDALAASAAESIASAIPAADHTGARFAQTGEPGRERSVAGNPAGGASGKRPVKVVDVGPGNVKTPDSGKQASAEAASSGGKDRGEAPSAARTAQRDAVAVGGQRRPVATNGTGKGVETASSTAAARSRAGASPAGTEPVFYWVQLGAFREKAAATQWYGNLKRKNASILGGTPHIVTHSTSDGTEIFRVRVGPYPNQDRAGSVCRDLKSAGVDCVVRESG